MKKINEEINKLFEFMDSPENIAKAAKGIGGILKTRDILNDTLRHISKQYWPNVGKVFDNIKSALAKAGLTAVQEDGTPFEGIFTGEDGRAVIDLAIGGDLYARKLVFEWHKMESGNYEINTYIS